MFTPLVDFKSVIWNVSGDCLQCNKVSGEQQSERSRNKVRNRTYSLENCCFKHSFLNHINKKTWILHNLGDRNRFLFSSTDIGLTSCSAEKAELLPADNRQLITFLNGMGSTPVWNNFLPKKFKLKHGILSAPNLPIPPQKKIIAKRNLLVI